MRVGGRHLTGAHFKHCVARRVEIKPGSGVVKFEIGECDEMPQGAFFAVFARMPYYDGFQKNYSTVTALARLRGLSTSQPRSRAM